MSKTSERLLRLTKIAAFRRDADGIQLARATESLAQAIGRRDHADALLQFAQTGTQSDVTGPDLSCRERFTQFMILRRMQVDEEIARARTKQDAARERATKSFGTHQAMIAIGDRIAAEDQRSADEPD